MPIFFRVNYNLTSTILYKPFDKWWTVNGFGCRQPIILSSLSSFSSTVRCPRRIVVSVIFSNNIFNMQRKNRKKNRPGRLKTNQGKRISIDQSIHERLRRPDRPNVPKWIPTLSQQRQRRRLRRPLTRSFPYEWNPFSCVIKITFSLTHTRTLITAVEKISISHPHKENVKNRSK